MIDTHSPARPESIKAAAQALQQTIGGGALLKELPGKPAFTLSEAYAVQDEILRGIGPVGGWKVAPFRDGTSLCAPIPASFFKPSTAHLPFDPTRSLAAEVEVAVRFGRDLPLRATPYTVQKIAEAISSVHPAIEFLSARFQDREKVAANDNMADLQNCQAVVVGPGRGLAGLEFAALDLGLWAGSDLLGRAPGGPSTEATLAALGWLVAHIATRGHPVRAGQTVITGARLGPINVGPGVLKGSVALLGDVIATIAGS